MDDLRIGVIGAGGRGALANNAHNPGKGSILVAGADVNPKALIKFKETYGEEVFVTDDYRKLLERKDIDAVFVTSPDFLHEEQARPRWKPERRYIWKNRWQLPLKAVTGC